MGATMLFQECDGLMGFNEDVRGQCEEVVASACSGVTMACCDATWLVRSLTAG